MSKVFLAERDDGEFEQQVALKLMHGCLHTKDMRRRFLRERQILGRLAHPNIARLFDGGTEQHAPGESGEGTPYFAMEYVSGSPITQYCDEKQISIDERLCVLYYGV